VSVVLESTTTLRRTTAAAVDDNAAVDSLSASRSRRGLASKLARAAVVLLVALACWSLVAWVAARSLVVSSGLPRADAVVVLAGSAVYVERAARAAQLYREGRAPRVVLTDDGQRSGWSSAEQRNPLFVERAAEELVRLGVPADRIEVAPGFGLGTYSEARLLRRYADSRGLRSVLFVTSAYHSRRAWWSLTRAFEGSAVEIGIDPVAPGAQTPPARSWWLSSRGWREITSEYAKLVYYHAHY
jgi:uncharacterized SAM-binding protein YcdF (DUF218 family)